MAQLTSLNDINRLLHETLGRERAIDAELEGLLAKRGDVEGRLLDLRVSTAEVSLHLMAHFVVLKHKRTLHSAAEVLCL